jgi:hypothetical protein
MYVCVGMLRAFTLMTSMCPGSVDGGAGTPDAVSAEGGGANTDTGKIIQTQANEEYRHRRMRNEEEGGTNTDTDERRQHTCGPAERAVSDL